MEGKAKSEEYTRYIICKEFGWDYYTFDKQPPFFLEEIVIFMKQENEKSKGELNKTPKGKGYSR